jgi:hypothetical protein
MQNALAMIAGNINQRAMVEVARKTCPSVAHVDSNCPGHFGSAALTASSTATNNTGIKANNKLDTKPTRCFIRHP